VTVDLSQVHPPRRGRSMARDPSAGRWGIQGDSGVCVRSSSLTPQSESHGDKSIASFDTIGS
jgi:hypothetical protein